MNKRRAVLAGLIGGIILFVWLFLAHDVLGLGEVGVKQLPTEQPVVETMRAHIPEAGFYYFPGFDVPMNAPRAERNAAMPAFEKKLAAGPVGILVYKPGGSKLLSPSQLLTELLNDVVQGLALAMIIALLVIPTWKTGLYVGFAAGIIAATATNISQWNWYGFPTNYTIAQIFIELLGFIIVGLFCGWMLRPRSKAAEPVARNV